IASANFVVTGPHISLSPASGPAGTGVTITGGGFNTGDAGTCTPLVQTPTTPTLFATPACTVLANGQLSATSFSVAPTATNGQYVVSVKGTTGDTASATFDVNPFSPAITVNPGAVSDGGTVTITGSGFNTADAACTVLSVTPLSAAQVFTSASPACTITAGK